MMNDQIRNHARLIMDHPLRPNLISFREPLRHVNQERPSQVDRDAISDLLAALQLHPVARKIQSPIASRTLNADLAAVYSRLVSNDLEVDCFRLLIQAVVEPAPDAQIWEAAYVLVRTVSRTTPARIKPATNSGTPVTRSSALFQGTEQTKDFLVPHLHNELRDCTFRRVDGFYEKYFRGRPWTAQSQEIYRVARQGHTGGRWEAFPKRPDESPVWNWLANLQERCFGGNRGRYYRTSSKAQLEGAEAERQLDVIVKPRDPGQEDTQIHNWKDVRVIGEPTASTTDWKDKFLQLARYMRDVFSVQPTRRFVHGFLLMGTTLESWVFDRSGAFSGVTFDVHKDPELFITVLAGYLLMSDEELGVDTTIESKDGQTWVSLPDNATDRDRKVILDPRPISFQRAIVCRGTSCYRSLDGKEVIKFSWASDKRRPESDHIQDAQRADVRGIAQWKGAKVLSDISSMRRGLMFGNPYNLGQPPRLRVRDSSFPSTPSNSFSVQNLSLAGSKRASDESSQGQQSKKTRSSSIASKLSQEVVHQYDTNVTESASSDGAVEQYANRVFSCIAIAPAGKPLRDFSSLAELLQVFIDTIEAHRDLYLKANILHRDISENNIIITEGKLQGTKGLLIDLDLATRVDSDGSNERSKAKRMTGTAEFMAIEVLEGADHTYRHDLESFFYVFTWVCVRYGWTQGRSRSNPLQKWYNGSRDDIAVYKRGVMDANGLELYVVKHFSPVCEDLKDLARRLREVLFSKQGLRVGTPDAKPSALYEKFVGAFRSALSDVSRW